MKDVFGGIAAFFVNLLIGCIGLVILLVIGPKTVYGMLQRAKGVFEPD